MKMKMIYVLMVTLSMSSLNYSQVSPEDLDNPQSNVKLYALKIIIDENLVEFIPEIQDRLFEQPTLHMQFAFLDALAKLQDSEIEEWTLSFIENADNFQYPEDPLFYKVHGTEILFSIGNYSSVEYVFDLLNRDQNFVDPICLNLLKEIVLNLSQWNQEATAELVRIFNNLNIDNSIRYSSLRILYETNYKDILNLSISAVWGDANPEIRFYANGILNESNYPGLHDLYVQQLSVEPEAYIRSTYATSLLILFGEPSDLNLVIEYQPGEPDEISRDFVAAAIENFIPPNQAFPSLDARLLNLISYTDELYEYEWITEEETYNYYQKKLYGLREAIENGYDEEACTIINEDLLAKIDQDKQGGFITTEGYKFLYYHTIYIKEIFEEEIGECQ